MFAHSVCDVNETLSIGVVVAGSVALFHGSVYEESFNAIIEVGVAHTLLLLTTNCSLVVIFSIFGFVSINLALGFRALLNQVNQNAFEFPGFINRLIFSAKPNGSP